MPSPRDHLSRAQQLHAEGRIEDAIAAAREALEADPDYVEALTYLGTTLVTRRFAFAEGLAALERAAQLAPDDAGAAYSLGWCYEFVAYRLEKSATTPYRDPVELYRLAVRELRRCIDLKPEQGLQEDAQDLLDSIEARLE
jgi:tetratricopeptide (TPR) repeat protein